MMNRRIDAFLDDFHRRWIKPVDDVAVSQRQVVYSGTSTLGPLRDQYSRTSLASARAVVYSSSIHHLINHLFIIYSSSSAMKPMKNYKKDLQQKTVKAVKNNKNKVKTMHIPKTTKIIWKYIFLNVCLLLGDLQKQWK